MSQTQPLPRSQYDDHLMKLGSNCAFCSNFDYIIKRFDSWIWLWAAFPYRKYHTLLIPQRHILHFSELSSDELQELQLIIELIKKKYSSSGIVGEETEFGNQLFFSWRSRVADMGKNPVAHFHLHIYPKFGGADDLPIDPLSHEIDIARLAE